ncbi:DMT family transporter [Pigmentiphaga aceris]|uniref:DMT family transporter n=1 Tax=Pigmentiphaga aceris TaxID=1940612 RepID=A0A5C0AVJ3_9BURK|nr:DMT family transporter [Pigmentiphaga aceris]QEI06215.1 DMT family transporter [Pigmentiphaga aceris]
MNPGILCGMTAVTIFSAQAVAGRFGAQQGLSPVDLTMLRYLFSGMVLVPALGWLLYQRRFLRISMKRLAVLSLMAGPLYVMAFVGAMVYAPASHSALIFPALTPVFTALIARRALSAADRTPTLALLLLITGVICAKFDIFTTLSQNTATAWFGDLLLVTTAFVWAGYTILLRRWAIPVVDGVIGVQLSGLPVALAYLLFFDTGIHHAAWTAVVGQGLYFGLGVGVAGSVLFTLAVRYLGAKAQMFVALTPVLGLTQAVWILDEPMTMALWFGGALVVAGLLVALMKKKPAV